tara:strand:- start:147 stop:617 length:471 start_codon:yes stop_codon:yes gene_type:complete
MAGAAVAGLIVVGTTISVVGQMEAGKNANKVAQRNAEIQRRDADIASRNAEFNAKIKEKEDDARRRKMVADQGGSGIEAVEGTNLLALAEQEFTDDLNAELIRRGGKDQASALRANASVTSFSGKAQQSAAKTGALGSLFTGLGSAGMAGHSVNTA